MGDNTGLIETKGKERVVEEDNEECYHCQDQPGVWLARKHNMELYNMNEHDHLPDKDSPPNNICHKKVYRQMCLLLNDGPSHQELVTGPNYQGALRMDAG